MIIIYRQKVQGYMKEKSVDNCPMAFHRRCEMVKEVKGNFKDKRGKSRPSGVMNVMETMSRHRLTVCYALAGRKSAVGLIWTR